MTDVTAAELRPLTLELLGVPSPPQDPYPKYRALREAAPFYKDDELGVWVLSRYEDCSAALRDPRLGRVPETADMPLARARRPDRRQPLLFLNPPEHSRQRRLVNRGFTPRRVETLRPHVRELTDECLDEIAARGEVDLMDLLAFPLPVAVIGELVGVPRADQAQFRDIAQDLTASLDPIQDEQKVLRVERAIDEFRDYFLPLIAARRAEPRDDLMSVLVQAAEDGDVLDEEEIMANTILLFAAGFETTTNLIGSGVLALLRHPDELQRLRDDRSLVPAAVEEMLRFESPVQVNLRYALHDAEVGGRQILADESLVIFQGAGNRDPAQFPSPDRFDVGRDHGPSLSFGGGIHYCLGAALARLEGQVVIERLLDRFSHIELLTEPVWRPSVTLRGVTALQVRCTPA